MLHSAADIPLYLRRRFPSQGTHGEAVIVPAVVLFQLPGKVLKGIEPLRCLSVAPLYFPIMPGSIRMDAFMADSIRAQLGLKEHQFPFLSSGKAFGELGAIVRLDTLNRKGKRFDQMLQEYGGGIGVVIFKGFHKPPAGVSINRPVLVKFLASNLRIGETYSRDEFDVNLDTLTGIPHLLVGF